MRDDVLVLARGIGRDYQTGDGTVMQVLSDVSCDIAAGDRIALTGPSGSGKSTLLHILAGLLDPTRGAVSWPALGTRDTLMPEGVQVAFQGHSLFPPLTVAQNIALPLVLAGRGDEGGPVAGGLLERFGLQNLADKLPEELSGGQAQRVAVLRALAIRPRLILADEPTGQLDGITAAAFMAEVLAVTQSEGMALVVATHDPEAAARMAVRWAIEHGNLRKLAPADGQRRLA